MTCTASFSPVVKYHGLARRYLDVQGGTEHPSLVSDPIREFIHKKMERRWAVAFAQGSVKIGSLFYYRTIKDDSGRIVDPHEGLEVAEVTEDLYRGRHCWR